MNTETDRELLELAAKAAGIGPLDFDYTEREGHGMYFGPRLPMPRGVVMAAVHRYWNPLTDDGDALRLAVKLSLLIDVMSNKTEVLYPNCPSSGLMETHRDASPYVATRRAIVRAAAEIGRVMP